MFDYANMGRIGILEGCCYYTVCPRCVSFIGLCVILLYQYPDVLIYDYYELLMILHYYFIKLIYHVFVFAQLSELIGACLHFFH